MINQPGNRRWWPVIVSYVGGSAVFFFTGFYCFYKTAMALTHEIPGGFAAERQSQFLAVLSGGLGGFLFISPFAILLVIDLWRAIRLRKIRQAGREE